MSIINKEKELNLDINYLYSQLEYCPETGYFTWLVSRPGVRKGKRAGSVKADGSRKIRLNGEEFLEHRLAWFYIHRVWPINIIDHIDRDKTNNKLCNLRQATTRTNGQNRCDNSEYGHNIYRCGNLFIIRLQIDGEVFKCGPYTSVDEAQKIRDILLEDL